MVEAPPLPQSSSPDLTRKGHIVSTLGAFAYSRVAGRVVAINWQDLYSSRPCRIR